MTRQETLIAWAARWEATAAVAEIEADKATKRGNVPLAAYLADRARKASRRAVVFRDRAATLEQEARK